MFAVGTAVLTAVPAARETDPTLADTLSVLDLAIQRLGNPSADYAATLREALMALPPAAEPSVRSEIRAFLDRLPAPGPEFRCSADFVRGRARYTLRRLRDTVLNEAPPPVEPAACYAVPFAVDAAHARATTTSVEIYGFDFDRVPLQMVMVDPDGYKDVTSELALRSHYHLTLRVGPDGARLSADSQSFALAWGHLIGYSIAVVQPTTPLCSSRIETIPGGRTASHSVSIAAGKPSGRGTRAAAADVTLEYSSNKLEATLCLTAVDPSLSGCTVEFLYTTDPSRVIEGVLGGVRSRTSYTPGVKTPYTNRRMPLDPVRRWTFSGFQTSVPGSRASVTSQFNEIRLVSSTDQACISPIAYLEAKRTTVFDSGTRKSLDAQLARVAPAILTLRPVFAPPIVSLRDRDD
jgi:hypothetical protein